ncbi:isocitrate dehydrogenase, partial [Klebsiella variicola]
SIDHAVAIPVGSKNVIFKKRSSRGELTLFNHEGAVDFFVSGPMESFYLVQSTTIDKTILEEKLNKEIRKILPGNVTNVSISLREEHLAGSYYHYTHGLKKHAGNCQRIAHGHRSAIGIFIDGKRSSSWEMYWADRWRDCYLMSEEDIVDPSQLSENAKKIYSSALVASAYAGSQGRFELLARHERVEILPRDTTIEMIAFYIKQEISYLNPELKSITVHAFEGIEKGAQV